MAKVATENQYEINCIHTIKNGSVQGDFHSTYGRFLCTLYQFLGKYCFGQSSFYFLRLLIFYKHGKRILLAIMSGF